MFENTPKMKPFSERTPDTQYQDLLRKIMREGIRTATQLDTDAITLMGPGSMHFKLENYVRVTDLWAEKLYNELGRPA